tara:strand:+ start:1121 stop:1453 length:333 start_codon:yes stop_codon:yes gene_type:complete
MIQNMLSTLSKNWVSLALILLLLLLQYRFFLGKNSIIDYFENKHEIEKVTSSNNELNIRNEILKASIKDLKGGVDAAEEVARNELGYIKPNETFFRLLPSEHSKHSKQDH